MAHKKGQILRAGLGRLAILAGVAILGLFLHEGGHGLSVLAFGGKIDSLAILPGIQLYPHLELIPWSGWVAGISFSALPSNPWQSGFITLMGCGSTALFGYMGIALLYAFRPRGLARFSLLAMAGLYGLDIITYSVFPLLGLRHWIIIGGTSAEPLWGALAMGIPAPVYWLALGFHILGMGGLIGNRIRLDQKRSKIPLPDKTASR